MKQKKTKKKHLLNIREMNKKIKILASGPYRKPLEEKLNEFVELIESFYEAHQEKLKAVAYHEAGHAVAAYSLLRKFDYISIIPNEDSLGCVAMPIRSSGNDFKEAVIDLAGFVAHTKPWE